MSEGFPRGLKVPSTPEKGFSRARAATQLEVNVANEIDRAMKASGDPTSWALGLDIHRTLIDLLLSPSEPPIRPWYDKPRGLFENVAPMFIKRRGKVGAPDEAVLGPDPFPVVRARLSSTLEAHAHVVLDIAVNAALALYDAGDAAAIKNLQDGAARWNVGAGVPAPWTFFSGAIHADPRPSDSAEAAVPPLARGLHRPKLAIGLWNAFPHFLLPRDVWASTHRERSIAQELTVAALLDSLADAIQRIQKITPFTDRSPERSNLDWLKLLSAARCFRVMAAWFRQLALFSPDTRCELCYRRLSTSRYCREHVFKLSETRRAAQWAKRIAPIFSLLLFEATRDVATVHALGIDLTVSSDDRLPLRGSVAGLPRLLRRNVSTLAIQLRRLRPLFGPKLELDAAKLFSELIAEAMSWVQLEAERAKGAKRSPKIPNELQGLTTLQQFFRRWYRGHRQQPGSRTGWDVDHPFAALSADSPPDPAMDLLFQREWRTAEDQLIAATVFDKAYIFRLKHEEHKSLREIAALANCSHETVSRILKGEDRVADLERRRTRLGPRGKTKAS